VRERSHWNSSNLAPLDPVTLGLCSQIDLDFEVNRSSKDRPAPVPDMGQTLLPAEVTTAEDAPERKPNLDIETVFAKLKMRKNEDDADDNI
jgi:hypothetical protein